VKTLSVVADIFTGTAIVGGLVSVYFTYQLLRGHSSETEAHPEPKTAGVRFDVGPSGAKVLGQFLRSVTAG